MQIRTWNFARTVAVATALGALLAYGASLLVPKHYVSQAVISIDSSGQKDIGLHMHGLSQRVLSRASLTKIIANRNLFQNERSRKPLEDVIERMRESVQVLPMQSAKGELVAFALNYSSDNPVAAQRVNSDLVAGFIDENVRSAPGEGMRMMVLDPSSLPKRPSDHTSWIVGEGLVAGLLAGLIIGIVQLLRRPAKTA